MGSRVSREITLEIYKYLTKEVNQVRRLALPLFSTRHPRQISACIEKVRFWPKAAARIPRISVWRVSALPQKQPLRC
jgi:hypothetical protein